MHLFLLNLIQKKILNCLIILYCPYHILNNTLSDHLVNLTNNKEICNIYSSLIKGKNDNLLTSLEITDLTKNYKSINNLQIPINNIFDNIQINLRDSNNNNYDFNGVLYLMFSLGCKL